MPRARGKRSAGLTRRGWGLLAAALVVLVAAYQLGNDELLFVACLLGAVVGLSLLLVRFRAPHLSAARRFSHDVVSVGSEVIVSIEVTNDSGGGSAAARWADRLPWHPFSTAPESTAPGKTAPGKSAPGNSSDASDRLPPIASRASTRLEYVLHPPQRGIVEVGPLTVERGDPFGLARKSAQFGESRQLVVAPRVTTLVGSSFSLAGGDGSVRASRRNAAGNNDDLMTREYRNGDAMRRVHWRATARHGDLMVRQEEESSFPMARLIVDTRDSGYADDEAFEWALGMVASLGVHLVGEGFLLQLRETGAPQLTAPVEAGGGTGHDIDFLASLARTTLQPDDSSQPKAGATDVDLRGPVFAVVSRPSPETLRFISSQRERHEHGIALVIDGPESPAIETLSRAGWQCVSIRTSDDPAEVWAAAIETSATVDDRSAGGA
jgi:uncharacterized protein (DUF58 family)